MPIEKIPSLDSIVQILAEHWQIDPTTVRPCEKSKRLFIVEGRGFARVGFARGGLSAEQLVELVDALHATGCAAPDIIETATGQLFVKLGEATLSLEQHLPGAECSGHNLHVLPAIGRELGKIHESTYRYPALPGRLQPLHAWIDEKLDQAKAKVAEPHYKSAIDKLAAAIPTDLKNRPVRFGLTHGDVRSPNILCEDDAPAFTDFNLKYEPQLIDIAMLRNKWLMNGEVEYERPLSNREIGDALSGYHASRPLTSAEIATFPVLFAVYQAWRLVQDLRITQGFEPERQARWPIAEQLLNLPDALDSAREIMGLK